MANVLCKASVRTESDFARINVRKGSGTNTEILTTLAVGTMDLTVRDVQPDQQQKAALSGKVYQWFNVDLPDGGRGWIRDDLLDIVGDCGSVGYSSLPNPTWAFGLTRVEVIVRPPGDPERVRKAAFNRLDSSNLTALAGQASDPAVALAIRVKLGREDCATIFVADNLNKRGVGNVLGAAALVDVPQPNDESVVSTCRLLIVRGDESRITELGDLLVRFGDKLLAEDF